MICRLRVFRVLFGLLVLFALMPCGKAQGPEETFGENFRERCRRLVSGAYADSWNEGNRARDAVILAEKSLKTLNSIQGRNNKDLAELYVKLKKVNYDPILLSKREEIVGQIRLYHEQIETQEDLLVSAKRGATAADSLFKNLEGDVKKIFKVSFVDDPEGMPRKVFHRLDWISPCPKFRTLCPLPPGDAKTLRHLAVKVSDPEENCPKYANIGAGYVP